MSLHFYPNLKMCSVDRHSLLAINKQKCSSVTLHDGGGGDDDGGDGGGAEGQ